MHLSLSHYLKASALKWGAILNMAKVRLELIANPQRYRFFEKGMGGGVSYISIRYRYSKANNKYLKSYDPKQESKHIIYLDANKLSGFKWADPKKLDLGKYTSNSSNECLLEVDLEYPKKVTRST